MSSYPMMFNPCDECNYSYSKNNEVSSMCKICEFKQYLDLERQGRLIVLPEKLIGHKDPVGAKGVEGKGHWIDNHCSICGMTPLGEEIWEHLDFDPPKFEYYMNYCPNCGAKMG